MKPDPGTYALILQSHSNETILVGRWGQLALQPGYYIYVGSAFGPGGVQARVSRHLRTDKRKHWHIDYLRQHVMPVEVWVSYDSEHFEHKWASNFLELPEMNPIRGFGCSDCKCLAHLFFTITMPGNGKTKSVEKTPIQCPENMESSVTGWNIISKIQ